MHLQNSTENALERGVLKKRSTKNYARRAISILKHLSRVYERGLLKKNYEKLRAKGHFDFKTSLRACAKGGFWKKTTKNYARKAISILLPLSAHARKGLFEKKHEKLRAKGHFDFTSPFRARTKGAFTIGLKYVLTLMRSGSFCFLGENKHYFSGEMKHGHETFCTFVPQRI